MFDLELKNKVAIITGGSRGIGFAIAKTFIAEGARVMITGRNESSLESARAQLGENTLTMSGDAADGWRRSTWTAAWWCGAGGAEAKRTRQPTQSWGDTSTWEEASLARRKPHKKKKKVPANGSSRPNKLRQVKC